MELIEIEKTPLSTGELYSGSGYWNERAFIPNGYGKKYFDGVHADIIGFFKDGNLEGPSYFSKGKVMHTIIMKNNRANGWGLKIDSGKLTFGYYKENKMVLDLTSCVDWLFDAMMEMPEDQIMHFYKKSAMISVGYKRDDFTGDYTEGFHFMSDGTVYVGTTSSTKMTGELLRFGNNADVSIGVFEKGNLVKPLSLPELIDLYIEMHYKPAVTMLHWATLYEKYSNKGQEFDAKEHVTKFRRKYFNALLGNYSDFTTDINASKDVFDVFDDLYLKKATISDLQKTILTKDNRENKLIHTISENIFPLRNIELKKIINRDLHTCYLGMTRNGVPYGYGYYNELYKGFTIGIFPLAKYDKLLSDDCSYIFSLAQYNIVDCSFYDKYYYVGEVESKAARKGNNKYTTSRYGLAILENGMYIGEYPVGYHMKLCIGHFYDLNGNVYEGSFQLPIENTPEWEDKDGSRFPW